AAFVATGTDLTGLRWRHELFLLREAHAELGVWQQEAPEFVGIAILDLGRGQLLRLHIGGKFAELLVAICLLGVGLIAAIFLVRMVGVIGMGALFGARDAAVDAAISGVGQPAIAPLHIAAKFAGAAPDGASRLLDPFPDGAPGLLDAAEKISLHR